MHKSQPLPPNRGTLISVSVALALLLCSLGALAQGCTPADPADPQGPEAQAAVQILYLSGTGSAGIEVYGQRVDVSWTEHGIDVGTMTHCSVVEKLELNGINLGAGFLPPPMSDEACSALFPLFRAGAPAIPPGGGYPVTPDPNASGAGAADSPGTAVTP